MKLTKQKRQLTNHERQQLTLLRSSEFLRESMDENQNHKRLALIIIIAAIVVLFLIASAMDYEAAENDAAYYRAKVEAGIWPAQ